MDTFTVELEKLYVTRLIEFKFSGQAVHLRQLMEIEQALISNGVTASEIQALRRRVINRLEDGAEHG